MRAERIVLSVTIAGSVLLAAIAYKLWSPMTWEYAIVSPLDYELIDKLSEMGREGWEVASARRALNDKTGVYEIIFKRPSGAWRSAPEVRAPSTTNLSNPAASYSYTPPVSSGPGGPAISYPAPDNPRAQRILRACVNGKAVALERGKWVPYSIGGTAMDCVVEP